MPEMDGAKGGRRINYKGLLGFMIFIVVLSGFCKWETNGAIELNTGEIVFRTTTWWRLISYDQSNTANISSELSELPVIDEGDRWITYYRTVKRLSRYTTNDEVIDYQQRVFAVLRIIISNKYIDEEEALEILRGLPVSDDVAVEVVDVRGMEIYAVKAVLNYVDLPDKFKAVLERDFVVANKSIGSFLIELTTVKSSLDSIDRMSSRESAP